MTGSQRLSYNAQSQGKRYHSKWYFDGVHNPKGRSRIGFGSGRRPDDLVQAKKMINKTIQRKIRGSEVIKWKVTGLQSPGVGASGLFSGNTIYTLNPLGNIPIGTGETQRLSTEIFVKSVRLCMSLRTNPAITGGGALLQAPQYRLIWCRSVIPTGTASDAFAASRLAVADMFVEGTSVPFFGKLDPDRVTVLSDEYGMVPVGNGGTGIPNSKLIVSYAPIGKGFPYAYNTISSNSSNKNKNLYCVVIVYINSDSSTIQDVIPEYAWVTEFTDGN